VKRVLIVGGVLALAYVSFAYRTPAFLWRWVYRGTVSR
jgi:hypothetical protein